MRGQRIAAFIRWIALSCVFAVVASVSLGTVSGHAGTALRAGRIAFLRSPPVAVPRDKVLFVMNADGTGLRRLSQRTHLSSGMRGRPTGAPSRTRMAIRSGSSVQTERGPYDSFHAPA